MTHRPTFSLGAEFKDGNLKLDNERRYVDLLKHLKPGRYTVLIEKETHSRSLKQNAYFHGVIVQAVSDHTGYEFDEAKELLKRFCNPKTLEVVNKESGGVDEVIIGGSTASLSVEDFAAFCSRCQRWAAETLDIYIPDPNELAVAGTTDAA